ncbi:hypothetical protein [Actinomadura miaoliensis]|uniref:hypothetical protein n=1 Tax=Actinomadura miaoliensis TaxID=430685 RepID=UPI0031E6EA71
MEGALAVNRDAVSGRLPAPVCRALAEDIQRRFAGTGVLTWYGNATGRYWAYLPPPLYRLLEADDPEELAAWIAHIQRMAGLSKGSPPVRRGGAGMRRRITSGECGGIHVHPMRVRALKLHWSRVWAPERARVVESTCSLCGPVSYELVTVGGAYAIRRVEVRSGEVGVWTTPRGVRRRTVLKWWRALVDGASGFGAEKHEGRRSVAGGR